MPQLMMTPQYILTLSATEMRLICLALDGRIKFGEPGKEGKDATEARTLGTALFTTRAKQLSEYAKAHQAKQGTDDERTT